MHERLSKLLRLALGDWPELRVHAGQCVPQGVVLPGRVWRASALPCGLLLQPGRRQQLRALRRPRLQRRGQHRLRLHCRHVPGRDLRLPPRGLPTLPRLVLLHWRRGCHLPRWVILPPGRLQPHALPCWHVRRCHGPDQRRLLWQLLCSRAGRLLPRGRHLAQRRSGVPSKQLLPRRQPRRGDSLLPRCRLYRTWIARAAAVLLECEHACRQRSGGLG